MDDHAEHVKITVPLSLMEVVVDSVDPTNAIAELKSEKGIDLPKLWRQIRGMDIDEFITVDSDTAKVRVFKDSKNFRVTVHEEEEFGGDVEMRIPFQVMDFLFKDRKGEFRLSELVDQLRGDLPLTILEATKRDGGSVKVWLEEK